MNRSENKRSGLAIAGLVLGIIGLVISAVPIINNFAAILGVLAVIFGIISAVGAKKRGGAGRGMAIAGLVIGLVCVGIVLASQAMYSKTLDDAGKALEKAGKEAQDSIDTSTGKKTDELLKKDVSVELGQFMVTPGEYGINKTSLSVKVTNKNAEAKSYTIKIEAVDASGTRIAEDTVYANDLQSNGSGAYEAFSSVDSSKIDSLRNATFKVYSVGQS